MGCASSAAPAKPSIAVEEETPCLAKNYDLKQELGRGCFGQVRLCVNKKTCDKHAVKILKITGDKHYAKAARELELWKRLGVHEHVVTLLDSYVEPEKHWLVMERCCCSLSEKFSINSDDSSYIAFLGAFHQVFLGLQHCHSMNVIHRDIKAPNLLVDFNGVVKIADFGFSVLMMDGGIRGVIGSTPFLSPEMVTGCCYGFGTDIWSCGAVMYHLIFGSYLYEESSHELSLEERRLQMMKAIAVDRPKPSYQPVKSMSCPSLHVRKFIKSVLDRNVLTRPTAKACAKLILDTSASMQKKLSGASSEFDDVADESPCHSHTISTACPYDSQRSGVGDSSCPSPGISACTSPRYRSEQNCGDRFFM